MTQSNETRAERLQLNVTRQSWRQFDLSAARRRREAAWPSERKDIATEREENSDSWRRPRLGAIVCAAAKSKRSERQFYRANAKSVNHRSHTRAAGQNNQSAFCAFRRRRVRRVFLARCARKMIDAREVRPRASPAAAPPPTGKRKLAGGKSVGRLS